LADPETYQETEGNGMERIEVASSNVASIGYDPDARILDVEFNGGTVYRYHEVPSDVHSELMRADSIGRHLNRFVKGVFRCERLDE